MSTAEFEIVLLSLKVSSVAILAMLPIAFALAWLLARKRFAGLVLLDAVVHLPLVLPPVVTGWLLLLVFGAGGPIGRFLGDAFGASVMFRWTGAAIAAAVMAVVVCGLLLKSFWKMQQVEPGFNASGLTTFQLYLPETSYPESSDLTGFFARLSSQMAALPGVESASAMSTSAPWAVVPLVGHRTSTTGGSRRANRRGPDGDPSSVTAVTGAAHNDEASRAGSPIVAEQKMNVGSLP